MFTAGFKAKVKPELATPSFLDGLQLRLGFKLESRHVCHLRRLVSLTLATISFPFQTSNSKSSVSMKENPEYFGSR